MNLEANFYKSAKVVVALTAITTLVLAGCGGGGGGGGGGGAITNPSSIPVAAIKLLDANKMPIVGGTVTITNSSGTSIPVAVMSNGLSVSTKATPSTGIVSANLPAGSYTISVSKGGAVSTTKMEISTSNTNAGATALIPAVQDASGAMTDVSATAIVSSIGGQITSANGGVVANATVSLSSATAATVASTTTDANGNYLLGLNIKKTLGDANGNFVGNLRVSKTGYNSAGATSISIASGMNTVGNNYQLTAATGAVSAALFSEGFETGTCGGWVIANTEATSGWHSHSSGLSITNAAFTQGLVSLAPDDTSLGKVPDSIGGTKSCWYGAAANGANGDEQGNFMGLTGGNVVGSLNGGSSTSNHGSLVSPAIDLTPVTAGTPVSLSFNTFWEIESVNPNSTGFEIMEIDYSIDGGTNWVVLARLNPLSDPETGAIDRSPIPFSNTGYNTAPKWVAQEPIPLVNPATGISLAGQSIKIRFAFDTVDGLYNGFRGWMIDDVAVKQELGTYPTQPNGTTPTF